MRITLIAIALLTLASSAQASSQKIVIYDGPGGRLDEADKCWLLIDFLGAEVEIRGSCRSACTLVMTRVRKERLCFSKEGSLAFHQARNRLSPPEEKPPRWEPAPEATKVMVSRYPEDIQAWLASKGPELPYEGHWVLRAPVLWEMGYRKCED